MAWGRYKTALGVTAGVAVGAAATYYAPELQSTFTGWRKTVQGWGGTTANATKTKGLFAKAKGKAKGKSYRATRVPRAQPVGFIDKLLHFLFG